MENLAERYVLAFVSLYEFLESGRTYKDMTVEEFKTEVNRFWERCDIWKEAFDHHTYCQEKLETDFKKVRLQAKRLLL
ncbi:hypothetical protein QNH39_27735 [Neobacillus novalis]|uniref:Uncharacterized protein n=1 Tax=Neobacillus novalis TaxID=220687 RepID=A0AA95MN53_9BACI|nr:hypothetical protein [Neobacillus novalis]WHY86312.1 hypothetical protein QNH39_27735 [Neobacillus novalis]